MSFLPENYEAPASSSWYTKLEKGSTKLRIMSSPIIWWIYWEKTEDKSKPIRVDYTKEAHALAVKEAKKNADEKDRKVKHFWAMKVWNFDTKRLEIFEVTQKNIQETLRAYAGNEDWGDPVNKYNIQIVKEWDGIDTKYQIIASPSAKCEEAEEEMKKTFIDLMALYAGEDPFDPEWKTKWTEK